MNAKAKVRFLAREAKAEREASDKRAKTDPLRKKTVGGIAKLQKLVVLDRAPLDCSFFPACFLPKPMLLW